MTAPVATRGPAAHAVHRAWFVAAVTMGALIAAAGFRSSTGALLEPLEHDFGWSRATTSGAVSLNLIVYGLTAPLTYAEGQATKPYACGALVMTKDGKWVAPDPAIRCYA